MKWLLVAPVILLAVVDFTFAPPAPDEGGSGGGQSYRLTPTRVRSIGIELESAFGVKVGGQWRTAEDDALRRQRTGRRTVSDHVSGMALDLVGPEDHLNALARYLRSREDVRYVQWRVRDHWDHVHVSFR